MALIFVDVEATGLSPATGVMTEFGAVEFNSRKTFHGVLWEATPDPQNPAKPLLQGDAVHYPEKKLMLEFAHWISAVSKSQQSLLAIIMGMIFSGLIFTLTNTLVKIRSVIPADASATFGLGYSMISIILKLGSVIALHHMITIQSMMRWVTSKLLQEF